jgi:serine phosphatase RsbU (regulator of sigma subunit)
MSGYEVCEQIKAQRSVPVLHVSATAIEAKDRSEGLRRGADGFLSEPVEREELLASVAALLRGAAAERTALRLARRLRRLNEASIAMNQVRTLQQLADVIAAEACGLFDAAASIVLASESDEIFAVCDRNDNPNDRSEAYRGSPLKLRDIEQLSSSSQYLTVNLDTNAANKGLLVIRALDSAEDRAIADESRLVLTQFEQIARTAIKNVRVYDIERRMALTLQQSLLPESIPTIPNLDIVVRYQASAEHAEVGGDFYEIFALDDARVAIAVGDIVGHSLEAAVIMAQVRTGIRAYMLEGHDAFATIGRLNLMLQRFHPGMSATVCCAIYDWQTGSCELANAGHPPPLVVTGRSASFLPLGGTLLGVTALAEPASRFTLNEGETLILYTDGLIERRHESVDVGLARLARTVTQRDLGDLASFCDDLIAEVAPADPSDDIALVAIRRSA